jgi:hypothetical protein
VTGTDGLLSALVVGPTSKASRAYALVLARRVTEMLQDPVELLTVSPSQYPLVAATTTFVLASAVPVTVTVGDVQVYTAAVDEAQSPEVTDKLVGVDNPVAWAGAATAACVSDRPTRAADETKARRGERVLGQKKRKRIETVPSVLPAPTRGATSG